MNRNGILDAESTKEWATRRMMVQKELAMKPIVSINPKSICRVCFFHFFSFSTWPEWNFFPSSPSPAREDVSLVEWRWWLTNTGFLKFVDSIALGDDLNSGNDDSPRPFSVQMIPRYFYVYFPFRQFSHTIWFFSSSNFSFSQIFHVGSRTNCW